MLTEDLFYRHCTNIHSYINWTKRHISLRYSLTKRKLPSQPIITGWTSTGKKPSLGSITTGFRFFAECLRHSAKARLHSAKPLPSAALGKEHTAKNWSAKHSLPSVFYWALGKGFAECPGDTRQRKAIVTALVPLTVTLPSANPAGTRQRFFIVFLKKIAECPLSGPWQRCFIFFLKILCRVPPGRRSAKFEFFFKKNICRVSSGRHSAKFEFF